MSGHSSLSCVGWAKQRVPTDASLHARGQMKPAHPTIKTHFLFILQFLFRHTNIQHLHRILTLHLRGFFIKLGGFVHFFIAE
jgi:hypothetical protein